MKRIWLAALALPGLTGVVLAQPGVQQTNPQLAPNPDLRMPARKQQAPVPALLQTRANEIFITDCSGCHGATAQPGPSAPSLLSNDFLNSHTDAQIVQALSEGLPNTPNHKFTTLLFPDEMAQMPAYLRIRGGIVNRARGGAVPDISGKDFTTQKASFKVETLVRGFKIVRPLVAAHALAAYRGEEVFPGPAVATPEEIRRFVRENLGTGFHPAGTCKMGRDCMAVVDPELRVRGVEGLRVIDASIMPTVPSGNTNAPVIMIAEKGADMILGRQARADAA